MSVELVTASSDNVPCSAGGCLNVCLCETGIPVVLARWSSVEECQTHHAVTLKSLLESGLACQLHVRDEQGNVVPVRKV